MEEEGIAERLERGEAVEGEAVVTAVAESVQDLAAVAAELSQSEAAAVLKSAASDAAQGAYDALQSDQAKALYATAEEEAVSRFGEEAVHTVKAKLAEMAEIDAAGLIPGKLEVSTEMRTEVSQQATKIWDRLSTDSKTRELAALVARNVSLTSDSERVQAMKEAIAESLDGDGMSATMSAIAEHAGKIMQSGAEEWAELKNEGEQTWRQLQEKDALWEMLDRSKESLSKLRLEPGQSLMQNQARTGTVGG